MIEIKKNNYKLKTNPFKIKYKKDKYSIEECIINNGTYTIEIQIPLEIYYKEKIIYKYE